MEGYDVKSAETLEQAEVLIAGGWEYVCTIDGKHIFRRELRRNK